MGSQHGESPPCFEDGEMSFHIRLFRLSRLVRGQFLQLANTRPGGGLPSRKSRFRRQQVPPGIVGLAAVSGPILFVEVPVVARPVTLVAVPAAVPVAVWLSAPVTAAAPVSLAAPLRLLSCSKDRAHPL